MVTKMGVYTIYTLLLKAVQRKRTEKAVLMGDLTARHESWDETYYWRVRRNYKRARENTWTVHAPREPICIQMKGKGNPELFSCSVLTFRKGEALNGEWYDKKNHRPITLVTDESMMQLSDEKTFQQNRGRVRK